MVKTLKNKLLVLFASIIAFTVGAFCCVTNDALTLAFAETTAVTEAGNFEVLEGAAIKIGAENQASGIRWQVSVSKDYHDYVSSLGSVEYHTLVDNVPVEEKGATTTQVDILCTAAPTFNADGVWEYYASIVYDQLQKELEDAGKSPEEVNALLLKAYEVELYAKAYVKVTPTSGEPAIKYATTTGTARSIKGVAMHCVLSEEYTAEDDAFNSISTYAGEELEVVTTEKAYNVGITNMYSEVDGTGSVTTETTLTTGSYDVYVGARRIDTVTLDSDSTAAVTIPTLYGLSDMAGKDVELRFVDANNKVTVVPFRYATKVIATEEDVRYFDQDTTTVSYDGYYLLKNSIAFAGNAGTDKIVQPTATAYGTQKSGLTGTFDGNGFTLSGFYSQGGLFGQIVGGTVKNLAMTDWNCLYVNYWGAYPLGQKLRGATVDNCYISTANLALTDNARTGGFASYIDAETKISNSVIKLNYYFGSLSVEEANYGFISGGNDKAYNTNADFVDWNMEGVFVIMSSGCNKLVKGADISVYAQNQQTTYENDETSENKKMIDGVCLYNQSYTTNDLTNYSNFSTEENPDGFTQGYNKNLWKFTKGSASGAYANVYIKVPEWNTTPVKS